MHSQNCNFLPSKGQPSFNGSLPHNIGLLRNLSSKSFSTFNSSAHSSVHIEPTYKDLIPEQQTRANIMDFVYRFTDSSNLRLSKTTTNRDNSREKSSSCKQLISNYNTVTQMPLMSSHLVGGFVGSKSQLGRRPTKGFGVNMWDIIRELVDAIGNSSVNIVEKGNIRKNTLISNKTPSVIKANNKENYINIGRPNNKNPSRANRPANMEDTNNCLKQSYADVTKIKFAVPVRDEMTINVGFQNVVEESSLSECNSKPAIEHAPICNQNDNRSRIASECSVDSEDSFIVFEYCEEDDVGIVEADCTSSDDESLTDFDIIDAEESCTDNENTPPRSFGSTKNKKPSDKKVKFAVGKDLITVHPMVTWNYAYRAARSGPWETLARDSERFRLRIANTEGILSPILDPAHRETIFKQRFADSKDGRLSGRRSFGL